jgi:protein SCO1
VGLRGVHMSMVANGWRAAAVALGVMAVSACGGSGATHAHASAGKRASLDGPTFTHPVTAPPFQLRDYQGHEVKLSSYRGKAVLLTFIYTHCPDVCPTIVAGIHNALGMLGANAAKVQVIGVSVDPRGDTRAAVADFLARHAMTGRMEYLVGSRATLLPVWRKWGVNAANPTAGDTVSHTAVVFGIGANGKVMTAYPANFKPSEIAHDVPLLAAL